MQARNVQRSESLKLHMPLLANAGTQLSEIEKNIQKLERMPWPEIWDVFQPSHTAIFQLAITRLSRRSIYVPWCFILLDRILWLRIRWVFNRLHE